MFPYVGKKKTHPLGTKQSGREIEKEESKCNIKVKLNDNHQVKLYILKNNNISMKRRQTDGSHHYSERVRFFLDFQSDAYIHVLTNEISDSSSFSSCVHLCFLVFVVLFLLFIFFFSPQHNTNSNALFQLYLECFNRLDAAIRFMFYHLSNVSAGGAYQQKRVWEAFSFPSTSAFCLSLCPF